MNGEVRHRLPAAAAAQAELLIATGQCAAARELLEGWPSGDADFDIQRLLAIEALGVDEAPRALRHAALAASLRPDDAFAQMLVGRAHKAAGDWTLAEAAYRRALRLDARLAQAHVSLGIVLRARGDLAGAIACHRQALRLQPSMAAAHANLGVALAASIERGGVDAGVDAGLDGQALSALRQAVAAAPREILPRHNLAVALTHAGRLEDAAEQLNAALAMAPERLDSCLMLHAVLVRAGWQAGARTVCEKWLSINPLHPEVASRLATTLLALDEPDAAIDWARRALPLAPQMPELHHNLAHALQQRLDAAGALHHLALANRVAPGYAGAWHTRALAINYIETDPQAIAALHRQAAAACFPGGSFEVGPTGRRPPLAGEGGRPLRVGFVSGDLRRHSVAYFIEPLFDRHDRSRFEFHAYSTAAHQDEVSGRLRAQVAHWSDVATLGDSALAARIAQDGIDVLIDLSGHTADTRLGVFAQRAAPLQATYLGYPTTTGMATIDLRISDAVIDPPGSEPASIEALLRLGGSMFCFRPDRAATPAVAPLPALRAGSLCFGSFNNLAKLSPATLALWARVLHAVPASSLRLKARGLASAGVRQRVLEAFAGHGIDAGRLRLDAWRGDLGSHLSAYDEIDIALDTYPFNGATTTCEALWMGVPVLSLSGATHVSRTGASILHAARLHDAVLADADSFVARAAQWAADIDALAARRGAQRAQLQASELMDEPRFVRRFERALLGAWAAAAERASA